MAFLTEKELKTVATTEVVNLITSNNDGIVVEIIEESIDLMKSYLFKHYDTEQIFSAIGDDRSKVILKYLKDIVIYEIYIRRTKQYNEVAKLRYDEAMLWLEKVGYGKIDVDLPRKPTSENATDKESSFMKLGSRRTYKNHW